MEAAHNSVAVAHMGHGKADVRAVVVAVVDDEAVESESSSSGRVDLPVRSGRVVPGGTPERHRVVAHCVAVARSLHLLASRPPSEDQWIA